MLRNPGEALYRFLIAQSSTPPTYHLRITGTHEEARTRIVNSNHRRKIGDDGVKTKTEITTEVVVDFDFRIDLTPNIIKDSAHAPVQWSVLDDEPAYRGKVYRQVEVPGTPGGEKRMREPGMKELEEHELWCKERNRKGLPPWIGSCSRSSSASRDTPSEGGIRLRSSRTVREWCDDYCASDKLLKEFVYTKVCGDGMEFSAALMSLVPVCIRLGFWCPRTSHRDRHQTDRSPWHIKSRVRSLPFCERHYYRQTSEYPLKACLRYLDKDSVVDCPHLPVLLALRAVSRARGRCLESLWRQLPLESCPPFTRRQWTSTAHF